MSDEPRVCDNCGHQVEDEPGETQAEVLGEIRDAIIGLTEAFIEVKEDVDAELAEDEKKEDEKKEEVSSA